jgi:hypothetical protein
MYMEWGRCGLHEGTLPPTGTGPEGSMYNKYYVIMCCATLQF